MALDRLLLSDFRNHRATAIEGTARFNLLVGDNGAGKTNVLEAISLFAPGRGLRRASLADMPAQAGGGGFAVSAELATPAGPVRLGTGVSPDRPGRRDGSAAGESRRIHDGRHAGGHERSGRLLTQRVMHPTVAA